MSDDQNDLPATSLLHSDLVSRDGAVVAPIVQASTFAADSGDEFLDVATKRFSDNFYVRYGNPNHTQVADVVATLEGAERAIVTASGMGAVSTLALALLNAGDHVIVQRSLYPGTTTLTTDLLARFGVSADVVSQSSLDELESLLRPSTRLIFVETPSNPHLAITDVRRFAEIAHDAGALLIADNTVATPINQRPLALGADVVWHSATKYLAGHSDVSAGVIAGSDDLMERSGVRISPWFCTGTVRRVATAAWASYSRRTHGATQRERISDRFLPREPPRCALRLLSRPALKSSVRTSGGSNVGL